jgi:hypothetical protein
MFTRDFFNDLFDFHVLSSMEINLAGYEKNEVEATLEPVNEYVSKLVLTTKDGNKRAQCWVYATSPEHLEITMKAGLLKVKVKDKKSQEKPKSMKVEVK